MENQFWAVGLWPGLDCGKKGPGPIMSNLCEQTTVGYTVTYICITNRSKDWILKYPESDCHEKFVLINSKLDSKKKLQILGMPLYGQVFKSCC